MSLYCEIRIRAPMDRLWEYTQMPERRARWDWRLSTFGHLFGLAIRGDGETTSSRDDVAGTRTVELKFVSKKPFALIRGVSGYMHYVPTADGVIRLVTECDYETRFGALGAFMDRFVFRPLWGWSTAWSFDCLRLWLEEEIAPEISREKSFVAALARVTLAFLWLYQGLVPKLLFRDSGELSMLQHVPLLTRNLAGHELAGFSILVLSLVGVGEMLFGIAILAFWHSRIILYLNNWGLLFLGLGALVSQPRSFIAPFNPLTFNLAMAVLAAIALLSARNLPSARACLRRKPATTGSLG